MTSHTWHPLDHSRHQIDVCISGLVGLCKRCRSCPSLWFIRQCVWLDFWSASSPMLASICDVANDCLFSCTNDSWHLLRPLLSPTRDDHYNLRRCHCNLQLPAKTSTLCINGFIKRMLYKNTGCDQSAQIVCNKRWRLHLIFLTVQFLKLISMSLCFLEKIRETMSPWTVTPEVKLSWHFSPTVMPAFLSSVVENSLRQLCEPCKKPRGELKPSAW